MTVQDYLSKMGKIQTSILAFIDDYDSSATDFMNLIQIFNNQKILNNQHELKSLLHILSNIADNHHRGHNFIEKIQQIIKYLKIYMKKFFSNISIFNIFKSNKSILLFLLKEKILTMNETIASILTKSYKYKYAFYPQYLFNSIQPFLDDESIQRITRNIPKNYDKKLLLNGENDHHICELIRNDMIDDFIKFVGKEKAPLNRLIEKSIFETNPFLTNKKVSLIEYVAFFGSINIFKYLLNHGIKAGPSLWEFAVHGRNNDIINLLKEKKIEPKNKIICYEEAIKCHHNEIARYIKNEFFTKDDDKSKDFFIQYLKYYNVSLIQPNYVDSSSFFHLCQYDYSPLVSILSKDKNIDINQISILYIEYLFRSTSNISMKFILNVNKTPLFVAVENQNIEIVQLLLMNDKLDVNIASIL